MRRAVEDRAAAEGGCQGLADPGASKHVWSDTEGSETVGSGGLQDCRRGLRFLLEGFQACTHV